MNYISRFLCLLPSMGVQSMGSPGKRWEGVEENEIKICILLTPCLQGYLGLVMCLLSQTGLYNKHFPFLSHQV